MVRVEAVGKDITVHLEWEGERFVVSNLEGDLEVDQEIYLQVPAERLLFFQEDQRRILSESESVRLDEPQNLLSRVASRPLLYLAPALVFMTTFTIIPIIRSFMMSFYENHKLRNITKNKPVVWSLDNFQKILTDPKFYLATKYRNLCFLGGALFHHNLSYSSGLTQIRFRSSKGSSEPPTSLAIRYLNGGHLRGLVLALSLQVRVTQLSLMV